MLAGLNLLACLRKLRSTQPRAPRPLSNGQAECRLDMHGTHFIHLYRGGVLYVSYGDVLTRVKRKGLGA